MFKSCVVSNPGGIALRFGDSVLTYQDLDVQSDALASYLVEEYGLAVGDYVGILQDRSIGMIVSLLGILKAGGAYVPIDPDYPSDRRDYLISDSGLGILLTQTDYMFDLGEYSGHIFAVDAQLEGLPEVPYLGSELSRSDIAYVIYTSGSTGVPKGCLQTHGNVSHYVQWSNGYYFQDGGGNFGLYSSLSFDLTVTSIFCSLTLGKVLEIYPSVEDVSTILLDSFRSGSGIDSIKLTPSHVNLLSHLELDRSDIGCVILGGEPVSSSHISILKGLNPLVRLYNEYGPTETTVGCMVEELSEEIPVSLGRPIGGVQIYILGTNLEVLPLGVSGEICIGGLGVGAGYLNRSELSAEKFVSHPFIKGERLYRSGDIGRWMEDGRLIYEGRSDDQVKIRGYRIELGEIQSVLSSHPAVLSSAVLAQDDGSGSKELVAYVVGESLDTELEVDSVRKYLQDRLPLYAVPSHYIALESLPLTGNGKLDRVALSTYSGVSGLRSQAYVAPVTAIEQQMSAIWQDVLGVDQVGLLDNFFDLGGHSLTAMRLVSHLHKEMDVKIELKDIFTFPVLAEQSRLVSETQQSSFVDIVSVPESDGYVLSSSQRRLWVLSQFEDSNIAYNMPGVYVLEGSLDVSVFEDAFRSLISRHEILRTYFREDDQGEVLQVVVKASDFDFVVEQQDLRAVPDCDSHVLELINQDILTPFNLSELPLLRATLYRLGEDKWLFTYVMHHIISDGWSMGILIKELLLFYNSALKGEEVLLSDLDIQYKDYSVWQQSQLEGSALESHRSYWLDQLGGSLPVLSLPTDYVRPAMKTYNGDSILRLLPDSVYRGLTSLSHSQDGSLFMGLLSGVYSLLSRYTHQEDIIIGSPIAGREHSALDGQIGFYLNTLALRLQSGCGISFMDLLADAREVTLGGYSHQVFPFDQLIDELDIAHDVSRNVLFDVLIDYHDNRSKEGLDSTVLEGLEVSGYRGSTSRKSKFDLTFMFIESDTGLRLLLEYNSDLYKHSTIARMFDHFESLLSAIVASPEEPIASLDYISVKERDILVSGFNEVALNYHGGVVEDSYRCVVDMFKSCVVSNPGGIALRFGDSVLTYQDLDVQSDALASYLVEEYGLAVGDYVGILQDRSIGMIVSLLGILKAGGAYVPIDPDYPSDRRDYLISDSGLGILLTQTDYMFDLGEYSGHIFAVDAQLEGLPEVPYLGSELSRSDIAYVIYTSGSTGVPKGCLQTHGNVSHYVQWSNGYYFQDGGGNFGLYSSLSFDLTVTSIFCSLTLGKVLEIYPSVEDVSTILLDSFKSGSGIDSIKLTPSHVNLLSHLELDRSDIGCVILGGEPVSSSHISILKGLNPLVRLYNEYGPTETTVGCMVEELSEEIPVSLGRPIGGVQIYILGTNLEVLPLGVSGEICIGGLGVGAGYLNRSELSAEKFVSHPFIKGERLYRSGDIGRWMEDGRLIYEGRSDDQVKIRGYRIELGEIQSVLSSHPAVLSSAVLAQDDGSGSKELVAYVVGESLDTELEVDSVRKYLQDRLPLYAVPSHYIALESLPLTGNGKLDRVALSTYSGVSGLRSQAYVAPVTAIEQQMSAIWQDVLGVDQVGLLDNFFDLGGDSLSSNKGPI